MYHAAARATGSEILKKHPQLKFQEAGFRYSLSRSPGEATFSVSNGADHTTANAAWAFGVGEIGQTYLLENGGSFIEGRLTYYTSLNSLDITPGHSTALPEGVEQALGVKLDDGKVRHCFLVTPPRLLLRDRSNRRRPRQVLPAKPAMDRELSMWRR